MYSEWASEGNPNWAERSVGETEADLRNQLPAYDSMHERVCFDAPTRVAPQEYSSSCPYENVAGRELFVVRDAAPVQPAKQRKEHHHDPEHPLQNLS